MESLVAVLLALLTRSVTSIVISLIVSAAIEVVLSFTLLPLRPKFSFDKIHFRKIVHSGKWVTFAGIFNYLYHNGDDIAVGRLLNTTALGYYDAAYKISMLPITEVADVVSRVTFPVFTKIATDKKRLKKALIKTELAVAALAIPLGAIFFFFPEQIVRIV